MLPGKGFVTSLRFAACDTNPIGAICDSNNPPRSNSPYRRVAPANIPIHAMSQRQRFLNWPLQLGLG